VCEVLPYASTSGVPFCVFDVFGGFTEVYKTYTCRQSSSMKPRVHCVLPGVFTVCSGYVLHGNGSELAWCHIV